MIYLNATRARRSASLPCPLVQIKVVEVRYILAFLGKG
jgi:hypothetical protein